MRPLACVILLFALCVWQPAEAAPGLFSLTGLKGWEPQTFRDRPTTAYQLVSDRGTTILEARCNRGASGWLWKEEIDLAATPVLSWRWQVEQLPQGAGERSKSGDDFAARVYVVIKTGWAPWEIRSLVYVWARQEPVGSDWPNAYTGRAHVVALRTGPGEAGRWQQERRDLRADLHRYLGVTAERVDTVALMSDCDDGAGTAQARYGDLRMEAAGP